MQDEYQQYKRKGLSEMRPYVEGEDMTGISISEADKGLETLVGGYVARNPKNHLDQWYVAEKYFNDNLEPADSAPRLQEAAEWVSEKPDFKEECTFVTATKYKRNDEDLKWDFSVWQIKKLDGEDIDGRPSWYFGLLDGDGEEWGDLDDLRADLYLITAPPKPNNE